jgi:hypothetical protein
MIKAGNKISTISSGKNIIAEAEIPELFHYDFGIYDLNEFLGIMNMFSDPEVIFEPTFSSIQEGANKVKFFAAAPGILTSAPTIKEFPKTDIVFTLTNTMINQIMKSSSVLKVNDFIVSGKDGELSLTVKDKSNPTGNIFSSVVGETNRVFDAYFQVDNLKIITGNYEVSISDKRISRFQYQSSNSDYDLKYFIALEMDSVFE